jgi:putative FmdB family regulatory protein
MPTYEYVCAKCGHNFDKVQSIKDNALKICPKEDCAKKPWGKGKVKRAIVGGSGLLFKGTGFYETDYRSENYKAAAKKEAGASASSESKSRAESKSDKTESKPATSTPPPAPAPAPAKKD